MVRPSEVSTSTHLAPFRSITDVGVGGGTTGDVAVGVGGDGEGVVAAGGEDGVVVAAVHTTTDTIRGVARRRGRIIDGRVLRHRTEICFFVDS